MIYASRRSENMGQNIQYSCTHLKATPQYYINYPWANLLSDDID